MPYTLVTTNIRIPELQGKCFKPYMYEICDVYYVVTITVYPCSFANGLHLIWQSSPNCQIEVTTKISCVYGICTYVRGLGNKDALFI